ncbi:hypothetical protein Zmor_000345 [Zophobas morio]|uniref:Uncharacterized protein n=1 Tax=Zophobas morio TaxID=2755281 RepID=A0AA38IWI2_9CUCU|nr:hypothetical protein Zmor_000345 [Zophobas morio]
MFGATCEVDRCNIIPSPGINKNPPRKGILFMVIRPFNCPKKPAKAHNGTKLRSDLTKLFPFLLISRGQTSHNMFLFVFAVSIGGGDYSDPAVWSSAGVIFSTVWVYIGVLISYSFFHVSVLKFGGRKRGGSANKIEALTN